MSNVIIGRCILGYPGDMGSSIIVMYVLFFGLTGLLKIRHMIISYEI